MDCQYLYKTTLYMNFVIFNLSKVLQTKFLLVKFSDQSTAVPHCFWTIKKSLLVLLDFCVKWVFHTWELNSLMLVFRNFYYIHQTGAYIYKMSSKRQYNLDWVMRFGHEALEKRFLNDNLSLFRDNLKFALLFTITFATLLC